MAYDPRWGELLKRHQRLTASTDDVRRRIILNWFGHMKISWFRVNMFEDMIEGRGMKCEPVENMEQ